MLAPPGGAKRDFLGSKLLCANLSDDTKSNTSNGARGAKIISFRTGCGFQNELKTAAVDFSYALNFEHRDSQF